MLGVVNYLLTIPRDNDHFGCFFENSLNRGVQNSEPSIYISPVPRHYVKLRFHCTRGITHCTKQYYTTPEVKKNNTLYIFTSTDQSG